MHWLLCLMHLKLKMNPIYTGPKLNVHSEHSERSQNVLDVFWTSCVRSIYVLFPEGKAPQSGITSNEVVVAF